MKRVLFLFLALFLLFPSFAFAQHRMLCDTNQTCAMNGDAIVGDDLIVGGDVTIQQAVYGGSFNLKWVSTEITLSGATTAATNLIPAGSFSYGCLARVTEIITNGTGSTTWSLGDGTTATLWGTTLALAAGTTTTFANFLAQTTVAHLPKIVVAAISPTATASAGSFTGGKVRISCLIGTSTAISR